MRPCPGGRSGRSRVSGSRQPRSPRPRSTASRPRPPRPASCPRSSRLVDELEERRISPGRWYAALRAWAAEAPAQSAYAEELAALYGAYRDGLERLGRRDARLHTVEALDRLRLEPARWGGTPVLLYGFDDLTPLQRDTVETLAVHCGADVTVSLTYEPGRAAFAGRGATFQELLALGAEHVALRGERRPLRRRSASMTSSAACSRRASRPFDPGGGVVLLEGGGERAELELVAAHVARLIREERFAPEEIAVVLRSPDESAALLADVFAAAGDPDRALAPTRRRATPRSAAACSALLRCALLDGTPDDLLAWLRTPGKLERPALADRLEAGRARRPARGPRPRRGRCGRPRTPTSRSPSSTASPRRTPRGARGAVRARSRPRPPRSSPRRTAARRRC